jgi:molecular chaperone DnaK
MTALIPRNTTIPTSKGETFTTAADGQTSVEVHVLQGERPMAGENKSLARFILDGILPAPRGIPQVEVTFDIDANGILNVSAKDKATAKEQKIVIQASSGLAKDEIDRMVREAEANAAEDAKRRDDIEERNRADSLAYQAEKIVRESGDKLPADLKGEVEEKTKALQDALKENDMPKVRESQTALQDALNRAGQAVYMAQQAEAGPDAGAETGATDGQPGAGGQPGGGSRPGTVEGEYREV